MGRLADAVVHNILDVRFGGAPVVAPATYQVGLSLTEPTDIGGNVTEPVGGGYARVDLARNAVNFPAAAARAISNGVEVLFPAPTGNWGTVGWHVLYDKATGVFQGWGKFQSGVTINAGGTAPRIPVGGLVYRAPGSA